MNSEDFEKLRSLLGPEFNEEEMKELLKEDPAFVASADSLTLSFRKLREEIPPPLSPDFTQRAFDRVQAPSLWERIHESLFTLRGFSLAGALAVSIFAATVFLPRFFSKTSFPGLALREETGPHQEKIFYVRFAIKNPKVHAVSVAGDFNQWSEVPLTLADAREGLYTVELPIPSGTYTYAFLVDGKKWIADPTADRVVDDGFGNKNSLINL
jgi:hypothetical protein